MGAGGINVSFDVYSCIPSSGPYIKGARRDQISWQIAVYFKINEFLCIHLLEMEIWGPVI